jgi:hypothetical protein
MLVASSLFHFSKEYLYKPSEQSGGFFMGGKTYKNWLLATYFLLLASNLSSASA